VLCLDGEIIHGKDFSLEIVPRAVRFILPDPLPRDSGEENPSN
jgi:diacylglycerol kinase family enzyme